MGHFARILQFTRLKENSICDVLDYATISITRQWRKKINYIWRHTYQFATTNHNKCNNRRPHEIDSFDCI